jgi:hypothetical protein
MMNRDTFTSLFEYKDGTLLWKTDRKSNKVKGRAAGSPNDDGYILIKIEGAVYKAHHIVWSMHNLEIPDGFVLDHINGDPADNRIENLRLASRQQNNCNAKLRCDNTSGVKGVSWYKKSSKWIGQIQHAGRKIHVGLFESVDEAATAVSKVRALLHGEFSKP